MSIALIFSDGQSDSEIDAFQSAAAIHAAGDVTLLTVGFDVKGRFARLEIDVLLVILLEIDALFVKIL